MKKNLFAFTALASDLRYRGREIRKLAKVTLFLLKQYAHIPRFDEEVRGFFNEAYLAFGLHLEPTAKISPCILRRDISEIFPDIQKQVFISCLDLESQMSFRMLASRDFLLTNRESYQLFSLVNYLRPNHLLEIGTYRGWTAANFALNAPEECVVYVMDINRPRLENPNIKKVWDERHIQFIQADSQKYHFDTFTEKMDFIFVDGDHSYESAKRDSENALKILSDKGVIAWHDFNSDHPGVVRYLNELGKKIPLTLLSRSSIVIHKKT